MKRPRKYKNWQKLLPISRLYKTRGGWRRSPHRNDYEYARRNGWLNNLCTHMVPAKTSCEFRHVYVFEFPKSKSVYIGLTFDPQRRKKEHFTNGTRSSVKDFVEKTGESYIFKVLTKKPLKVKDAQLLEHNTKVKYENKSWNILNKGKTGIGTGALGGHRVKWTKKRLHSIALKYKTKSEWQKNDEISYDRARYKPFYDEITFHMRPLHKNWTIDLIIEKLEECKSRKEMRTKYQQGYRKALRLGIIDNYFK